jgi:acetylornithine/succinyldiaminopimelate/putrescine aminotransferase
LKSLKFGEVRGEGLLLGLQLSDTIKGADVVAAMLKKGYLINCAAKNTLRFAPPYVITKKQIKSMLTALKGVL